jgi:hypothetical protein
MAKTTTKQEATFWRFVYERQRVWHRSVIERQPAPFTDDPILRSYRFTNVQRELDRGTIALFDLIERGRYTTPEALTFNVMLYRWLNNADSWDRLVGGWVASHAEADAALGRVRAGQFRGEVVTTRAWTLPQMPSLPGDDALDKLRRAVARWDPAPVVQAAYSAPSLRGVHQAVQSQPAIGRFIAFQIALDLTYVFARLSDDEWVLTHRSASAGGSAGGARLIDRDAAPADTIRRLRDQQEESFEVLGLNWPSVAWSDKPRLTLADIEHSLCEFAKYDRLRRGVKTSMRRFEPRSARSASRDDQQETPPEGGAPRTPLREGTDQ